VHENAIIKYPGSTLPARTVGGIVVSYRESRSVTVNLKDVVHK